MELAFEYTIDCGEGHAPQAVHANDNTLRIFFLTGSNTVAEYAADPVGGLYDDLEFISKGRVSPDETVSLPSIKRVAHYGAYGFWSAEGDHRFVIYMQPSDISKALVDGSITASVESNVTSFSCNLLNVRGRLLNESRALVTPGTRLEVYFTLGNEQEMALGVFYVDRASVSYPEEKISVTARNAIGKLLKEQTFDERTLFDALNLQDNIRAVLEFSEVADFFVGDPGTQKTLEFEPDTTILEGLQYAISLLPDWKIGETTDGVVGVALKTDARFEQPGVHSFLRDRTCWQYNIDYDDTDAASRVCVYSKDPENSDQISRVFAEVRFNKFWAQPSHRTLYAQTVDGATTEQMAAIADTLAESLAASGRLETFAGIFTPQLTLGDEVRVLDESGRAVTVGSVTDVTHSFGSGRFITSFTADSGGRRGRARLKDLITSAADFPELFTGIHHNTPVGPQDVEFRNAASYRGAGGSSYTFNINARGGNLVLAHLICRTPDAATPEGWTRLFYSDTLVEGTTTQYFYVFYKESEGGNESAVFNMGGTFWAIVHFTAFANADTPYVTVNPSRVTSHTAQGRKNTYDAAVWAFHNIYWNNDSGYLWEVTGVDEQYVSQVTDYPRLLTVCDIGTPKNITAKDPMTGTNHIIESCCVAIATQN